jgi:hypothetical protein
LAAGPLIGDSSSADTLFNLRNGSGSPTGCGVWDIQWEIGKGKCDALQNLGYDVGPGATSIDNMDYVMGKKQKANGGTDVVIAFQGTDGWSDDEDIFDLLGLADKAANYNPLGLLTDGQHKGYYEMAKKLWSTSEIEDMITRAKSGEDITFNLSGHSMGGAIAQCLAIHLMQEGVPPENIKGVTFACALTVTDDINKLKITGSDETIGDVLKRLDWTNYVLNTDAVPNGVVKGSIKNIGGTRIGKDNVIIDPIPDSNKQNDFWSGISKTDNGKHDMSTYGKLLGKPMVTMYNDVNSGGDQFYFQEGDFSAFAVQDKFSSIEIPEGYRVTLYEHNNYGGKTLVLNGPGTYNLTDHVLDAKGGWFGTGNDWNDDASSMKVEKI